MNFISLATLDYSYPKHIILYDYGYKVEVANGKEVPVPIQFIFKNSFFEEVKKENIRKNFLFCFSDVKVEIDTVILKWFKNYEHWKPVFNSFFSTTYNQSMYNEDRFLNIARALETFHAIRYKDFKKSTSLETRIIKLHADYSTPFTRKILKTKTGFVNKVVNSRNYYTHYNPEKRRKAVKGISLYYLTDRMIGLLLSCFLKEFGFSEDKMDKILSSNQMLEWLSKK